MRFSQLKSPPLALEVDTGGLRLLQLTGSAARPQVVAAARRVFDVSSDRSAELNLAEELRLALEQAPFTTRRVVSALPGGIVHIRTVRIGSSSGPDMETAVRAEAAGSFPFDLAGAALRCLDAGIIRQGSEQRREVIAVAARRSDIASFLDSLRSAGLVAESLRLAPFASLRRARGAENLKFAIADSVPDRDGGAGEAVIDVGVEGTTVLFARAGDQLPFLKPVPIGGRHLNQAVAQKLGMTSYEVSQLRRRLTGAPTAGESARKGVGGAVFDAMRATLEELARQVSACFRYHAVTFRGEQPHCAALAGAESADPHLRSALAAALPISVEAIDALAGIDTSAMRWVDRERNGEWTTCIGLALSALPETAPSPSAFSVPAAIPSVATSSASIQSTENTYV